MVIKTKFIKQDIPYRHEYEYCFSIYVNNKFYKEIGGLPTFLDCIKLYKQEVRYIRSNPLKTTDKF